MDAFTNYVLPHSVVVHLVNPPSEERLRSVPGVTRVEFMTATQVRIFFDGNPEITEKIIEAGYLSGWKIREITLDKSSLDEIFAQLSNNSSK